MTFGFRGGGEAAPGGDAGAGRTGVRTSRCAAGVGVAWRRNTGRPQEISDRLKEAVEPYDEDRPPGPDLTRVAGMLERGEFGQTFEQRNRRTESVR